MKALVPTGQRRALVALADTGVPEPQPGEALVKVEAFSVNRGEIFQLEHPHPAHPVCPAPANPTAAGAISMIA